MNNNLIQQFREKLGITEETINRDHEYMSKAMVHVEANNNNFCGPDCELCCTHFEAMRDAEGR